MQTNNMTLEFLWVPLKYLCTLKATKLLFQITLIQAGPSTTMTFISGCCVLK